MHLFVLQILEIKQSPHQCFLKKIFVTGGSSTDAKFVPLHLTLLNVRNWSCHYFLISLLLKIWQWLQHLLLLFIWLCHASLIVFPSFEMLADIFEKKKNQFSSECLHPCNSVSTRHLVSRIISVINQKQTLNHHKRIKSLGLFSSVISYTQKMMGESKKNIKT